jgi:hypothetical protein
MPASMKPSACEAMAQALPDFNLAGRLAGLGGVCRYVTDKQGNKKMISL